MQLDPQVALHRAAQTRVFDTSDGVELLSASAAALCRSGDRLVGIPSA